MLPRRLLSVLPGLLAAGFYLGVAWLVTVGFVGVARDHLLRAELDRAELLLASGRDLCAQPDWSCGPSQSPSSHRQRRFGDWTANWTGSVLRDPGGVRVVHAASPGLELRPGRIGPALRGLRDLSLIGMVLVTATGAGLWLALGPMRLRRRLRRLEGQGRRYLRGEGAGGLTDSGDPLARALKATLDDLAGAQAALIRTERLASLGYFSAGLAHQFGNPLAASRQYAEVLAARLPAGADRDILERLRAQLDRLHRAVEGLLRLARPERLEPTALPLAAALRQIVSELKATGGADVDWRIDVAPELRLLADPLAFEQICLNLLRNAIEAGGDAARIDISAQAAESRVLLRIRDYGTGLSGERDPLSVLESGKPGGTGLGLPLAARLSELLGGRLRLFPAPDGPGAEALLELPCAGTGAASGESEQEGTVSAGESRGVPLPAAEKGRPE